jgi:hypothetical protein
MNLEIQEQLKNIRTSTVKASDIKIKSDETLIVGGSVVPMAKSCLEDILKIVGINRKTVNHLNDTMDDGASGYALIQMIMKHLATKANMKLKLVVDLTTQKIIRIADEGTLVNAISLDSFEKLMDLIGKDSDKIVFLDPVSMDGGTKVSVQVKWDQTIPLTFKGEDIALGKQFTYDMFGSMTVEDLVERQICTNGMTGIVPAYATELTSNTDPAEWYKQIIQGLRNPNQDFIKHYEKLLLAAKQSNLSVSEYNMVKFNMLNWKNDAEIIRKYLGDENWKFDYENRGIDLTTLTKNQLANCPTPVNKWDAINLMTDLSSHVYQSHVDGRTMRETQKLAGKFLRRPADEDRLVYNVPTYRNRAVLDELVIIE